MKRRRLINLLFAGLYFLDPTGVAQARPALVIGDAETCRLIEVPRIVSLQPRLDFLRVLVRFFKPKRVPGIHPTAASLTTIVKDKE